MPEKYLVCPSKLYVQCVHMLYDKNTRMLDYIQSDFALRLFFLVNSDPQSSAQPKICPIDLREGAYRELNKGVCSELHTFLLYTEILC